MGQLETLGLCEACHSQVKLFTIIDVNVKVGPIRCLISLGLCPKVQVPPRAQVGVVLAYNRKKVASSVCLILTYVLRVFSSSSLTTYI